MIIATWSTWQSCKSREQPAGQRRPRPLSYELTASSASNPDKTAVHGRLLTGQKFFCENDLGSLAGVTCDFVGGVIDDRTHCSDWLFRTAISACRPRNHATTEVPAVEIDVVLHNRALNLARERCRRKNRRSSNALGGSASAARFGRLHHAYEHLTTACEKLVRLLLGVVVSAASANAAFCAKSAIAM